MLDVMVERIAISNTLERKAGDRRNEFGQMRLRCPKPAALMGGKESSQRIGCQLGNRNHKSPPSWFKFLGARVTYLTKEFATLIYLVERP